MELCPHCKSFRITATPLAGSGDDFYCRDCGRACARPARGSSREDAWAGDPLP